jgi:hypothetical protein
VKLRNYVEAEHTHFHRLKEGHKPACEFVAQFPKSAWREIVAQFLLYTLGGVFSILLLLGLYEDDFMTQNLTEGRSVTWYVLSVRWGPSWVVNCPHCRCLLDLFWCFCPPSFRSS